MNLVDGVALIALVQLMVFAILVGRARGRYGVQAPAVTGHEVFERYYRVQMNTLELIVILLPAMYIGARHWSPQAAAAAGAVYLVGRLVYAVAYVKAPARRGLGFMLSVGPIFVLLAAGLWGVLRGAV